MKYGLTDTDTNSLKLSSEDFECDLGVLVKQNLKGPRPVLMKDCLKKWTDKRFKENDIFMEKVVGFASNYLQKGVSHWASTD